MGQRVFEENCFTLPQVSPVWSGTIILSILLYADLIPPLIYMVWTKKIDRRVVMLSTWLGNRAPHICFCLWVLDWFFHIWLSAIWRNTNADGDNEIWKATYRGSALNAAIHVRCLWKKKQQKFEEYGRRFNIWGSWCIKIKRGKMFWIGRRISAILAASFPPVLFRKPIFNSLRNRGLVGCWDYGGCWAA